VGSWFTWKEALDISTTGLVAPPGVEPFPLRPAGKHRNQPQLPKLQSQNSLRIAAENLLQQSNSRSDLACLSWQA